MSSKIPTAITGKLPFSIGTWSLYIHVPFCTKKCPYCHFFVQKSKENQFTSFTNSLLAEWHLRKEPLMHSTLQSLYFGGGTPSLLPPHHLELIISTILKDVTRSDDFELTLEVNPESYTKEKAIAWKGMGINRLSIGVQSFSDQLLKTLGRTHTSQEAIQTIHELVALGFENISIDLMLETPGQMLCDVTHTLQIVKELPLPHLSLYNMTFEEGSLFYRKQKSIQELIPPDEENLSIMKMVESTLVESGFNRYEISAFCKDGKASIHNTGYWLSRPFLGLGPSAFSFLDGIRTQNVSHLTNWQKMIREGKVPTSFVDEISQEERYKEQLLIALRMLDGIDLPNWIARFGSMPLQLAASLKEAIQLGWLEHDSANLRLTTQGTLFYDSLGALCI